LAPARSSSGSGESGEMSDENVPSIEQSDDELAPTFPWLRATAADAQDLNFEAPIATLTTAECSDLSDRYRAAAQGVDDPAELPDTPGKRVFTMLWAITGMHFKPEESNEPFGPVLTFADGRRSAIPSDFRKVHLDLLAEMATRARHPVLRARLADICWLLDRKRAKLARLAMSSYLEIVRSVENGSATFRSGDEAGALDYRACELLRRALQIGRLIGWEKSETTEARNVSRQLRIRAIEYRRLVEGLWFSELDLDFGVSDPSEVASGLDQMLAALPPAAHPQIVVDLWRLGARAYHLSKRDYDKYRCQSEASECLVAEAEADLTQRNSAMLACHRLNAAIAQLHGIPGKKDRRTELLHRLIDVQARIPEEMSSFSHELDIGPIVEQAQKAVREVNLLEQLFIFANLAASPEPRALTDDALEVVRKYPLSSLFGMSHHDDEGKVIHRTEGGIPQADANVAAVGRQIAQAETIRRRLVANGKIEAARQVIASEHFLSDDIFSLLLENSPFVPRDLVATFSRGFVRFFQGDFVSATYVLTPLLENSLRYALKAYGHDVTIFDDAMQTQKDRTLSSLFELMRSELDQIFTKPITTDIENVFLSLPGPQLRNSLSHGLLSDEDPYGSDAIYGCWLIFRLCLLPLVPRREHLANLFK
jgi:hypothetical protein